MRFHPVFTAASLGLAALLGGAAVQADDSDKVKNDDHRVIQNDRTNDKDQKFSESGASSTDPARIVRDLHFMAQYDIRASELAMQKAQNKDVRSFAKDVIEDWTKFDKRTVETSSELGFALGPSVELPASAPKTEETTSGGTTTPRGDVIPQGGESPRYEGTGGSGSSSSSASSGYESGDRFGKTGESAKQQEAIKRLERLQTLSGAEFDREYMNLMSECADRSRTTLTPIQKAIDDKDDKASDKVDDLVDDAIDLAKDHGEDAKDVIEDMHD